nr:cytochrome p450 4727A7 [Polyphagotarsonemus latus]
MIGEFFVFFSTLTIIYIIFAIFERIKYFKSFEKRNIPGPKPSIIFGNLHHLRSYENRNDLLEEWSKKYGKIFGLYYGTKRFISITDLDLIQKILITEHKNFYNRDDLSFELKYIKDSLIGVKDERWHNLRKNISPTFSHSRISSGKFDTEINSCIKSLNDQIIKKIYREKNDEIDIYDLSQSFTLDVISKTAFGLEENVYDENNLLKKAVSEFFQTVRSDIFELVLVFPFLKKICEIIAKYFSVSRLVDILQERMKKHIKLFLKNLHEKNAKDINDNEENIKIDKDEKKKPEKATVLLSLTKKLGKNLMTEDEFIGNVILILLAGFETTANSITTAFYALAKYPEMQKVLRESVLKDGLKSEYLDMFWHENLRIFPPVTLFESRRVVRDCKLDGIKFLKNDVVFIPNWIINRDPEAWPDPEKFDPFRFSAENKKTFHPCQFTSYGHGPRNCLGLSFANYEAKSVIAGIIKNFEIQTCSSTPDPLKFITPSVMNNPSNPVVLKFKKIS